MKLGEGQEAREGLKLGIVRLGKAGGKVGSFQPDPDPEPHPHAHGHPQTKYCLLEERDLGLVHRYTFEARTQVEIPAAIHFKVVCPAYYSVLK